MNFFPLGVSTSQVWSSHFTCPLPATLFLVLFCVNYKHARWFLVLTPSNKSTSGTISPPASGSAWGLQDCPCVWEVCVFWSPSISLSTWRALRKRDFDSWPASVEGMRLLLCVPNLCTLFILTCRAHSWCLFIHARPRKCHHIKTLANHKFAVSTTAERTCFFMCYEGILCSKVYKYFRCRCGKNL